MPVTRRWSALAGLGLEESDADDECETEDVIDEGQNIRRYMKVRKFGFWGAGALGGRSFLSMRTGMAGLGVEGAVAVLEARTGQAWGVTEIDFGH